MNVAVAGALHGRERALRVIEGLVVGRERIEFEDFIEGIARGCPGVSPADLAWALDEADRLHPNHARVVGIPAAAETERPSAARDRIAEIAGQHGVDAVRQALRERAEVLRRDEATPAPSEGAEQDTADPGQVAAEAQALRHRFCAAGISLPGGDVNKNLLLVRLATAVRERRDDVECVAWLARLYQGEQKKAGIFVATDEAVARVRRDLGLRD
jgi:hypothetical protein